MRDGPASLILVAAASAVAEWRGAFGSPDPAVLVGGVVLVIAGGVIGVAVGVGSRTPSSACSPPWRGPRPSRSPTDSTARHWLFPWVLSEQLGNFPQPVSGYRPGSLT